MTPSRLRGSTPLGSTKSKGSRFLPYFSRLDVRQNDTWQRGFEAATMVLQSQKAYGHRIATTSSGFHIDRAFGSDRDHSDPGQHAVAGVGAGEEPKPEDEMHEQPAADRLRVQFLHGREQ